MRSVSRFEANLLRILHCLLRRTPIKQALSILLVRHERPACLSRAAVALVQDALAKGCVQLLAREGGWRRGRHLRGDRVASGRLWDRTPPEGLGLAFSRHSLEFLVRLTADDLRDLASLWQPDGGELAIGDRLLLFLAYDALRETDFGQALRGWPPVAGDGLCRLAFPDDFADNQGDGRPDVAVWASGVGACVVEALQPMLARRWVDVERAKGRITVAESMLRLGRVQGLFLDDFLDAIDAAGRHDLARFLLVAASGLLREGATASGWVGGLDLGGLRMADRAEVGRAATAMLRRLDRLRRWDQKARGVGYLDEGYALSQLWKADWAEHDGDALWARARAIIAEVEPLSIPS
jgi:hypothetical protein